jgi:UDP-N-acetyl-D-glucosamine dehydrogenase
MPPYWVQKVMDTLNDHGKALRGSTVLVIGVAYKKDVNDVRESPALDIIHLLEAKGSHVQYHDPHVPSVMVEETRYASVDDLDATLQQADCTIIVTDHTGYDWNHIYDVARCIVDTRWTTRKV